MCVIATKKAGFALPSKEVLEQCFTSNPDGAGFAWNKNNKVHWIKGLMTFEAFYAKLKETFPTSEAELKAAVVMHFRIGTHGPKATESHTHPFPVLVDSLTDTGALSGTNEAVVFHNGIMREMVSVTKEKVRTLDNIEVEPSDSQIFTYYFVRPIWKAFKAGAFDVLDVDNAISIIASGQRIALLDYTGNIAHYGHWVEDKNIEGCSFSNTSYETPRPVKVSTHNANSDYWLGVNRKHADNDNFDVWSDTGWYAGSVATPVKTQSHKPLNLTRCAPFYSETDVVSSMFSGVDLYPVPVDSEITTFSMNQSVLYTPEIDGELFSYLKVLMAGYATLYLKTPEGLYKNLGYYYVNPACSSERKPPVKSAKPKWSDIVQKYPVTAHTITKLHLMLLDTGTLVRKEKYIGGWSTYCPPIDGEIFYYYPKLTSKVAVLYKKTTGGAFYVLGRFELKSAEAKAL